MIQVLIQLISLASRLLTLIVVVGVIMSYFMSPYHPVRVAIDKLLEPMLAPIRRIVPPLQMIDFSPLILIVLIQVLETVLINILATIK